VKGKVLAGNAEQFWKMSYRYTGRPPVMR